MPKHSKDFPIKKKTLKPKRSKGRIKLLLWLMFLFILALGLGYLLFFSPYLKIKSIRIENETTVPSEKIKAVAETSLRQKKWQILTNDSYFLVKKRQITETILQEFPSLKSAACHIAVPSLELNIAVLNREPLAIWCNSEEKDCFLVDEQAVAFQTTTRENYREKLPLIVSKSQKKRALAEVVYPAQNLALVSKIARAVEKDFKIPLARLGVDETQFLVVETKEGWEIYIDLEDDIDFILAKLKAILEQELTPEKRRGLQYLDLRFTKVYYK